MVYLGMATGPGTGLGRSLRYPDRVFTILLIPGPDLIYPDRTGVPIFGGFFLKYTTKPRSKLVFLLLMVRCSTNLILAG